jgi:hypothetical protein
VSRSPMAQKRNTVPGAGADLCLERRELLSRAGLPQPPAELSSRAVADASAPMSDTSSPPQNLFHGNGINGLILHKAFVNQMNDRLNASKNATHLLWEAFQVFSQGYTSLVGPPATGGSAGTPATLASLLADLDREVSSALSTREVVNTQQSPSAAKAPTFSPFAFQALVPFARIQIARMTQVLALLPPVPQATAAMNTAYNALLNSVAEFSLHPNLFQKPSDYYLNETIFFPITFDGNPATSAAGYFVRGPGGALLPGAMPHRHVPAA